MAKEHYVVLVIVGVVLVVAIGLLYFGKTEGRAFASPPTAAPAPRSPTPVPRPRGVVIEEISVKPSFPPEVAYWLKPGKLTTPGDAIKQVMIKPISLNVGQESTSTHPYYIPPNADSPEFNIVRGILSYVKNFNKFKSDPGCANCFNRNVNDVFSNGISSAEDNANCGHYALLFLTLARLYGIPAKFIDVYFTNWADEQKNKGCWDGKTRGHAYAQVYINGIWHGVDPMGGFFVAMDEKGNVPNLFGKVMARTMAEGKDNADYMHTLTRGCLESYRYHLAIPNLPLCQDASLPVFSSEESITCQTPLTIITISREPKTVYEQKSSSS